MAPLFYMLLDLDPIGAHNKSKPHASELETRIAYSPLILQICQLGISSEFDILTQPQMSMARSTTGAKAIVALAKSVAQSGSSPNAISHANGT